MKLYELFQNKWFRFIVPGAIGLIIVAYFIKSEDRLENAVRSRICDETERVKKINVQGEVVLKYEDFRKLNRMKLLMTGDTIDADIFVIESSSAYDIIEVGDFLSKKSGTLVLEIRKETDTVKHTLNYGCI